MATGEETDDESLGGAAMHATHVRAWPTSSPRTSATRIRLARAVRRAGSNWRKPRPGAARPPAPTPPKYDPEELLGIASADLRVPFDPREVLARVARRLATSTSSSRATAPRW